MRTAIICLWGALAFTTAYARIINIPADYPTIQAGIEASVNGDTVLVAPGEYTENPFIQDKNILLSSSGGPDGTLLHGRVSIFGATVDSTCIMRGFRINGQGVGGFPDHLVHVRFGSPIIWGNIIEQNQNDTWGAGIELDSSGAIARGNIIRDNWTVLWGGGIRAFGQQVIIEYNIISGNHAGVLPDQGHGGGIDMGGGFLRYNLIINNIASRIIYQAQGGGVRAGGSRTRIYNNTISGNSAYGDGGHGLGGGLHTTTLLPNGESFAKNNIIAFNSRGGGVYCHVADSSDSLWDYNLVFGNSNVDYIGLAPGPNDINSDPQFSDRFSGDYRLLQDSPCIDSGDPSFPLDPDSTRADIGAYYFDQSVGIDEDGEPTGPYRFSLKQNYPNPFNGQTMISYFIEKQSSISLFIFSITGHLIVPLANQEIQGAGEHKYIWEGMDAYGKTVSTGIYFYELYVNEHRESKAMILIK